jgi:uncharacterized oligopeptide transporter (OPT) family protein
MTPSNPTSLGSPPELTARGLATGAVLGALLAPCNIYAGLKIGWAFNMSVAAALVGFSLWRGAERVAGTRTWGMLESNINQTAASSAAAIAGAGLVAPIPAWTLLTGKELSLGALVLWVFTVSMVGVTVALGMRRRLLEVDRLPFPSGVATAETLKQLYAKGREGLSRVKALVGAASVSGVVKGVIEWSGGAIRWAPLKGKFAAFSGATPANLGWVLDPSLLLVGFGAIIGLRAGMSLLLGAGLAWGVLAPWALNRGFVEPGPADPSVAWFAPLVEWLLWPGVALMVVASLTSFGLSVWGARGADGRSSGPRARGALAWRTWGLGLVAVAIGAAVVQAGLFGIPVVLGVGAVFATFALAVVAGRVAGETGITPIGAMGKVTQLGFAAASPADVTTNLMAANVTGGAASQCADMLHDLKTGLVVGARPRSQAVAQIVGVFAGAWSGAWAYRILVPDPEAMLMTPEWPAPAVVTWKAVAELFRDGWDQIPTGAVEAMAAGAVVGVVLAVLERSPRLRPFVPSPASLGLACVLPAWNGLSMAAGALAASALQRFAAVESNRIVVLAAGLVAGESLVGVFTAFTRMLT